MSLTTICPKHGKQLAVGNWDECEKCVIEDRDEQESERRKESLLGRTLQGINYKSVKNTAATGEF